MQIRITWYSDVIRWCIRETVDSFAGASERRRRTDSRRRLDRRRQRFILPGKRRQDDGQQRVNVYRQPGKWPISG